MNLKISKWANMGGKVKMSLCDWGPAMANVLSSNRDKNLSWPSEAWTKKSEEHGKALIYTKGSGSRGHDGDEKGDTESHKGKPSLCLLSFLFMTFKINGSPEERGSWHCTCGALLWLPTTAQTHAAEGIIQGAHGFRLYGKDQSVLVPKSRQMLY